MLLLVDTYGHDVGLVQKNICRHENRVGKQTRVDVIGVTLALVLELSHAGKLAEHREAVEHPSKLGVCGHVRLNVKGIFVGVKTAGDIERKRLVGAAAKLGGHLSYGDGVLIHYAVEALIGIRICRKILDRAKIVTNGKISAGLNARIGYFLIVKHDKFLSICRSNILAGNFAKGLDSRNDLLVGGGRIVKAEGRGGSFWVTVEGGTGNDRDLARNGKLGELCRVHTVGKGTPNKQTALGARVGDLLRHFLVETFEHQIALMTVDGTDLFDVSVKVAFGHIAVAKHLEEDVGMDVLALLADCHLLHDLGGSDDKADSHTRRKDLGEGGAINDDALGIHALDGGDILTREAKLAVGVVLKDHHAVLFGKLVDLLAFFERRARAAGILKGGNQIQKLDARGVAKRAFECFDIDAVLLHGNTDGLCAARAEGVECADKAWVFADYHVTGVAEHTAGKVKTLIASRYDHGHIILGADTEALALTLCNGIAEDGIALCDAILQRGSGGVCKYIGRKPCQLVDREGFGRRISCGKGNDGRVGEALEDLTDRRRLQILKRLGKGVVHIGSPLTGISYYNLIFYHINA